MRYLIDGYNLMHALGMGPTPNCVSLERARVRLVEWLAVELHDRTAELCLVFDSTQAGGSVQELRGIRMLFADARTADDLIEELIRKEPAAAQLNVVSNDQRIVAAARRRGIATRTCGAFVDWLHSSDEPKAGSKSICQSEKPIHSSPAEMNEWLERFGG